MYKKAIEVLNIFSEHGYLAYIVGGYPRDEMLGKKTTDIDICTNARPKDIMEIFDTEAMSEVNYGYVRIIYKNYKFDVTTFRKDIKYEDNRKPVKIKYINDLKKDLLRRDFTINTICIDKDENFIDLLNAKVDFDKKIIKTVGNPKNKLKEDILRVLRAVRFASNLEFTLDDKTRYWSIKYGYLLKKLSGSRKKEELDKIFSSANREKGRDLLIELRLDRYLGINNLADIVMCDDIIGIWSQLELSEEYPMTKAEKDQIKCVREMLDLGISDYTIYKYGLYVSTVVGSIKGMSYKEINNIYSELPIYSRKDIDITGKDIIDVLKRPAGEYIKEIIADLEEKIINREIENKKDVLIKYVLKHYKEA